MNFLEQLAAEWYEHQGYWVRRNVMLGKLKRGGHVAELSCQKLLARVTQDNLHHETDWGAPTGKEVW